MSKVYVAIAALIFAVVALGHAARLLLGWQVRVGPSDIPMSVSWLALVVAAILAAWGVMLLRR
jgi:hypothetical protein